VSPIVFNIFEYGTQRLDEKTLDAQLNGEVMLATFVRSLRKRCQYYGDRLS